jgi:hypothetical protein
VAVIKGTAKPLPEWFDTDESYQDWLRLTADTPPRREAVAQPKQSSLAGDTIKVLHKVLTDFLNTVFERETEREDTTDIFDTPDIYTGWADDEHGACHCGSPHDQYCDDICKCDDSTPEDDELMLNDDDNLETWMNSTEGDTYTFEDPTDTFSYIGPPLTDEINPLKDRDEFIEYLCQLEDRGIPEGYTLVVHNGGTAWVWGGDFWYPVAGYSYDVDGFEVGL